MVLKSKFLEELFQEIPVESPLRVRAFLLFVLLKSDNLNKDDLKVWISS